MEHFRTSDDLHHESGNATPLHLTLDPWLERQPERRHSSYTHFTLMAALLFVMPVAVARVLWHHFKELETHIAVGRRLAEVRIVRCCSTVVYKHTSPLAPWHHFEELETHIAVVRRLAEVCALSHASYVLYDVTQQCMKVINT